MLRSKPLVFAALAMTLALAGCGSSSKNNNSKNEKGLFTQTAATQAAPVAATTVAAPSAASATRAPAAATAAGGATSPTKAATVAGVVTPPSAAAGSDVCGTSVSGSPGQTDANLQSQLAKVALTDKDLPSGYTSLSGLVGNTANDLSFGNQTASYSDLFVKGNLTSLGSANPFAGGVVIESLNGFKDSAAAGATLKDLRLQALRQDCSPDTKVEQVSGAPKLGDETLAYKISSTDSQQPYSGYLIVWRRGKVDAVVGQISNPGPKNIDETAALAQKLDAKMKAAGL
ncbi:MAG TPA: hypothetical protein VKV26_13430 [Dehalococcoidia bacterium]|nr:hypothetical protein [Dehalococcoidia bacterium]